MRSSLKFWISQNNSHIQFKGGALLETKILFIVLLQWIYHSQSFRKLSQSIGLTHSCTQTLITSTWNPITAIPFETYIPATPLSYTGARTFTNYPAAAGTLDATLFAVHKPLKEQKKGILVGNIGNMVLNFGCWWLQTEPAFIMVG